MGILTNNNDEILTSNQAGEVLKSNYVFGRAFKPTTNDEGIKISINSTSDWTIVLRFKDDYVSRETIFSLGDRYGAALYIPSKPVTEFKSGGGLFNYTIARGLSEALIVIPINNYLLENLFIGGIYYSNVIPLRSKITDFFLFNRVIEEFEIDYMYNNGLGNQPIKDVGLVSHITTSFVELIDFGSGDVPGFRNQVGSLFNGELFNLPSGTANEQLIYANENLLTQW